MTYEINDLTTGYRNAKAVHVVGKHITAQLQAGELTCLLGPNGAGKSTLLRTLAAFQPPLEGQLLLDGKPLGEFSAQQLATRIGIVLTERPDIKGMRVREMVAMGRSPYTGFWGRLTDEDEQEVDKALEQVGIAALQRRMVHTLSDGERQKVMIAKALAQQTPIIFLDEPTAFLDFPSKVEMLLLLRRLAREMHKTVFLSTHDLELALQTADRLWLMAKAEAQDLTVKEEGMEKAAEATQDTTPRAPSSPAASFRSGGIVIGTPRELADNGSLPRFFSGPGLHFDATNMRFKIEF